MAGLPTHRYVLAWLSGSLVLCLAACEQRTVPGLDGIEFGEDGDDDGDDGLDADSAELFYDDGESGGSTGCQSIVESLTITDSTDPATVECVEEVEGDLAIGPTTQLTDLSILPNLRSVGGSLYVAGNLNLATLDGLGPVEDVEWVHVRRNHNLVDLAGLDDLGWVDRITIDNNDGLLDLDGLPLGLSPSEFEITGNETIASLAGLPQFLSPGERGPLAITIADNPSLVQLAGLTDCCSEQVVDLEVSRNDALTDLEGLEGFERLAGLTLHDNLGLVNLVGITNVSEIGTVDIDYNHCIEANTPALVDFTGSESLASVETLRVTWVSSLTGLGGLEGLGDLGKLQIQNNALLPWSDVLSLADQSGPQVLDSCGGIDGPECPLDECPMF